MHANVLVLAGGRRPALRLWQGEVGLLVCVC